MRGKIKLIIICSSLLLFILFSLVNTGCTKNSNSEIDDFKLNDTIHIKCNQTLLNQEHDLILSMVSVVGDSRCPLDFTCLWEGNAEVKFSFKVKDKHTEIILDTHDPPIFNRDTAINYYHIKMTKLDPYPVNSEIIAQNDYIATLIIKKL